MVSVRRVLTVTGGKGGIGKSLVASTLALLAARRQRRVGLLDLDLTSPTDHVYLGEHLGFPSEEFGVDPRECCGVQFMSIAFFSKDAGAPLRGNDVTNALVELLAITRWPELDLLIVDMPPGLGDVTLDLLRLLGRAEHLVLATDSRVVLETVARNLRLLQRTGAPLCGVLENMQREAKSGVRELAGGFGVPYLGAVPWDPEVERTVGDPARLADTSFATALAECLAPLIGAAD